MALQGHLHECGLTANRWSAYLQFFQHLTRQGTLHLNAQINARCKKSSNYENCSFGICCQNIIFPQLSIMLYTSHKKITPIVGCCHKDSTGSAWLYYFLIFCISSLGNVVNKQRLYFSADDICFSLALSQCMNCYISCTNKEMAQVFVALLQFHCSSRSTVIDSNGNISTFKPKILGGTLWYKYCTRKEFSYKSRLHKQAMLLKSHEINLKKKYMELRKLNQVRNENT
jgi:hypothetical protein